MRVRTAVVMSVVVGIASFVAGWSLRPAREAPPSPPPAASGMHPEGPGPIPASAGRASEEAPGEEGAADAPRTPESPEDWLRRIREAPSDFHAAALAREILKLDPDLGRDVLLEIFSKIAPPSRRIAVANAILFKRSHPRYVAFLDLAARDPAPGINREAFEILWQHTLRRFPEDLHAYEDWYERNKDSTMPEIYRESVRIYVERLRGLGDADLVKEFEIYPWRSLNEVGRFGIDAAKAFRDAGGLTLARDLLTSTKSSDRVKAGALTWIRLAKPSREFLERWVLPVIRAPDSHPEAVFDRACEVLAEVRAAWAVDDLLEAFAIVRGRDSWSQIAGALARIGDKRAIPTMIAVIQEDGTSDSVYGIGYYGLQPLTAVAYDKTHDGAWWVDWWSRNREFLPEEVRGLAIPAISLRAVEDK